MSETKVHTLSLSSKGKGLSSDGKTEVVGALAGEELLVQLGGKQKRRRQAFLREVVRAAPERVVPRCVHSPECGGCAFQQMDYAAQLLWKENLVRELFDHEVRPIIGSEPWHYRNKMEFSFSQNRAGDKFLGLMLAGAKGRVFNLRECHLVSEWFSKTMEAVRGWWEKNSLEAYYHNRDTGHLRTLTLREAIQGKGKMVMLTVSGNPDFGLSRAELNRFVAAVRRVEPSEDLSVFVQVQQLNKGKPTQFFEMLLSGPDHITERLFVGGKSYDFKISPTSFFQPNTLQAQRLYETALGMLKHLDGARLFDLYCGGATIGLIAAQRAREVVGIERNPHSVFDAGWNQEVNGVQNFSIHKGDVGEVLDGLEKAPDVVVVDPPRIGLDDKAIGHLAAFGAKEILYISCNPKTQAANLESLRAAGYRVSAIQPVDQFPHTVHIENIVHLEYDR